MDTVSVMYGRTSPRYDTQPITSYGIIAIAMVPDTCTTDLPSGTPPKYTPRYCLVRRKATPTYVAVLCGRQAINAVTCSALSSVEVDRILASTYSQHHVYAPKIPSTDIEKRVLSMRKYIPSPLGHVSHMWEFPKGRRLHKEDTISCAMREFTEETGMSFSLLTLKSNVVHKEVFEGTDKRTYSTEYYIATIDPQYAIDYDRPNSMETDRVMWLEYDQAYTLLAPSRRDILSKIHDSIQTI